MTVSAEMQGIGVSPGVATGPVARLALPPTLPAVVGVVVDTERETTLATRALDAVAADLDRRSAAATGEASAVVAAQAAMTRDPVLAERVAARIKDGRPAPFAVAESLAEFQAQLLDAGGYLAERAADLDDIRARVVAVLLGVPMPGIPERTEPFVLLATDLAPADTATLDPGRVLAIVTERGGPTSHTAIISKSLGIPAVVACPRAAQISDGDVVLVDGGDGVVIVHPDRRRVKQHLDRLAVRQATQTSVSGPGRTADGIPVQLLVNVGAPGESVTAALSDSEGVGLFRTEFLFLDKASAPTVEEQRSAYREVFEAFTGRKVVVRTLDAGADKPLRFVTTPHEPNPALGMRGLRTSRRYPNVLDEQLQAIARAAAGSGADVWVMAPMVSTPREAAEFVGRARGWGLPVAGAMVEVPAAALRAADIAEHAAFLSVGTNDLAQYTYAADREATDLADLLDPWQPALTDLIRITARAGMEAGKPVGVCGEAASDPLLALVLVGLGVTSLSMAPVSIAAVRAAIAVHTVIECRDIAAAAGAAPDAIHAREAARALARL